MSADSSVTNTCPEEIELTDSMTTHISQIPRRSVPRIPSLLSTGYFCMNEENFSQKPPKNCRISLLRGPRKLLRLCICGLCLPIILISIPLYIRLILYPPIQYVMAPTDQRHLHHTSSSFWCRGQTVQMNGSFNAYLLPDDPPLSQNFSTHSMLQHVTLKDDVKEYWGFYLLKGSIVTINLCARYDGGMLMIMRGVNNLHKCAWIGEEDSAEQDEDHKDLSNESGQGKDYMHDIPMATGELLMEVEKDETIFPKQEFSPTESGNLTSEERQEELDYYIRKVLKLTKNKKEILEEIIKRRFKKVEKKSKSNKFAGNVTDSSSPKKSKEVKLSSGIASVGAENSDQPKSILNEVEKASKLDIGVDVTYNIRTKNIDLRMLNQSGSEIIKADITDGIVVEDGIANQLKSSQVVHNVFNKSKPTKDREGSSETLILNNSGTIVNDSLTNSLETVVGSNSLRFNLTLENSNNKKTKRKFKPARKKKKRKGNKKQNKNETEFNKTNKNETEFNRAKRFYHEDNLGTKDEAITKDNASYLAKPSLNLFNSTISNLKTSTNHSNGIYLSVLKITNGLTYERGSINQTSINETSHEEHRSSFSSSEEALMKCDGLVGVLPLYPNGKCSSFNEAHSNSIKYRVPITGTYYFVFSSDNEVFDLDMYFNMTLQRVVLDTASAVDSCTRKSNCSLLFSFWSNDQAVVDVPQGDWNAAYTMEIRCQPRVSVYLTFLFLIPILILFCAFR